MYKENVAAYAGHMNTIDTFKDNFSIARGAFRRRFRNIRSSLTIWNSIIKRIEGGLLCIILNVLLFMHRTIWF